MNESYFKLAEELSIKYGFSSENGENFVSFKENQTGDTFYLGNSALIIIRQTSKSQRILIKDTLYKKVDSGFLSSLPLLDLKSDPLYVKIDTQLGDDMANAIRPYLEKAIEDYKPPKSFACCSRYVQCSDAKKCIHPQQVYAKQCWYRENLENGKIFYGKNKNV